MRSLFGELFLKRKGLIILASLLPIKYLNHFFTKRDLIRYYHFVNIYILLIYILSFMLMKLLFLGFNITKSFFFLILVLLFSVKPAFCNKFIASILLIKIPISLRPQTSLINHGNYCKHLIKT